MSRKRASTALLFFLLTPIASFGLDLPDSPAGYSWVELSDIGGAILQPDGWNFRRLAEKDKLGYFLTEQPFEPPETFDIGITYNVMRDIPRKFGIPATEFTRQYIQVAKQKQGNATERLWQNEMGKLRSWGILYRESFPEGEFRFFNLLIANDTTGTVHFVIFEAPVREWEAKWRVIGSVMSKLVIDDEY